MWPYDEATVRKHTINWCRSSRCAKVSLQAEGLFLTDKDKDKDSSYKDQDKDQNFVVKDKDKDQDLTIKDQDKDKDFVIVLKESLRTRTRTRITAERGMLDHVLPFKFWWAPTISFERLIISCAVNLCRRSVW